MLCVPYAGLLYFPAWSEATGSQGGGIEVMGQRMIFFGAYLIAMALALLPATLLGGIAFLLANWLSGLSLALASAALIAGVVLSIELMTAIAWLGDRLDAFDVAQEMPR
jgi:ABC-2 type transport system permease protein